MVFVFQLPERFHGSVQIVIDNGKAVAVVFESFPSGIAQVLRIIGYVHGHLQDVGTAERCHRIHVHADDEVGIVGNDSRKVVVHLFRAEFQLVELLESKVEILILKIKHRR